MDFASTVRAAGSLLVDEFRARRSQPNINRRGGHWFGLTAREGARDMGDTGHFTAGPATVGRPYRSSVRFCVLGTLEVIGADGVGRARFAEAATADGGADFPGRGAGVGRRLVEPCGRTERPGRPGRRCRAMWCTCGRLWRRRSTPPGRRAAIVTAPGGYRLDADPDAVDAVRFTSLLNRGRQAAAVQDWTSARVFVAEGLALWRGPAYAEFAGSEFAAAEAARLEELRLVASETRFEIDFALGEDAALVPELEKALGEQPTRERLWELLIRALYRAGRQSDALLAYVRARTVLADELGRRPRPGTAGGARRRAGAGSRAGSGLEPSAPAVGVSARQPTAGVYAFDGRER